MKKISVAMATYNGEKYIIKQLQSIYEQTRQPDEVIICDDASTDDTARLVQSFIAERRLSHWRLFHNETNLGFKGNFRQAIGKTEGELIFLADQDDIWEANKVESMTAQMAAQPKIMALNCGYSFIDDQDKVRALRQKRGFCNNNQLRLKVAENEVAPVPFSAIVCHNYFPGCTLALTKELKDLFLEKYSETMLHDWFLNFLAAFYFDGLYFYNRPLIRYRLHSQNTIGMDAVFEKTVSSRSQVQQRWDEVAADEEEVHAYFQAIRMDGENRGEKVAYIESCLAFFEAKKRALEEKNCGKMLRLYQYAGIYQRYQSPQSRLMDLYAVWKKGTTAE